MSTDCCCCCCCKSRYINFLLLILLDILRTIRDPEKPSTLEDLNVVYEEGIFILQPTSDNVQVVSVYFDCIAISEQ